MLYLKAYLKLLCPHVGIPFGCAELCVVVESLVESDLSSDSDHRTLPHSAYGIVLRLLA